MKIRFFTILFAACLLVSTVGATSSDVEQKVDKMMSAMSDSLKTDATKAALKPAPKPPVVAKPAVKHLWNLQGVDIKRVVTEISRETGKNFILDPQVQGKITIISSHSMGPEESYQVFLSSLMILGYAVVPDGDNLKIVSVRDSASQSRLASDGSPGVGDQAVVRVIKVRYVSAMQLIPALRPLLPTWGNLSVYSPSNAVIVSGAASNVQRIADIISEVDTPSDNDIDVVHLQHAVADDVVKEVNQLIMAARANGSGNNATLSSDEQSNSVLIGGSETSRLQMKVLIAKIDSADSAGAANNTKVIYLKYIQVKDILPILKGIVHQSVSYSGSSGGASYASSNPPSSGSGGNSSFGQSSGQFDAAANSQITNATLNSGSSADSKSKVTIVGDVTNNALIITADGSTMMKLRTVINELDVPPKQVLVQGVVAEVDAQTAKQIGVQWGTDGTASPYSFSSGGMGVGFLKAGDMRALLALLASDTNANIVSTPSIMVLNNSPADIQVGQDISQVSAEYSGNGPPGDQPPPTTYSDKQVGLTLKVIPQITGEHSVRLVIAQSNSSIVETADTSGGSVNPNKPTNQESLSTEVIVNDGQVLVLGGLISATDNQVTTKVPFLGDIPILGRLFRSTSTQKEKKNLMIFLRPVIVRGQQQANIISNDKYDYMRDVAILGDKVGVDFSKVPALDNRKIPALPTPFSDN